MSPTREDLDVPVSTAGESVRFSLWPSNQLPWSEVVDLAALAESDGWHGFWVSDHVMGMSGEEDAPVMEGWSVLAAVAAVTSRIRVGTLVSPVTYRHPALLAKMAITVDHISGGRLVLGLGAGWQRNEHDAFGLPFAAALDRLARLDEACRAVLALLRDGRADLSGRHFALEAAVASPRPVGRVPLLIGGAGERVTLGLVARHADEWNTWGTPEEVAAKGAVLDEHCRRLGRDPRSIVRSAQALVYLGDDRDALERERAAGPALPALVGTAGDLRRTVAAYRDAGVTEIVVPDFTMGPAARKHEILARFAAEVASDFTDAETTGSAPTDPSEPRSLVGAASPA